MDITDVIPMTDVCKAVSRALMETKGYTSAIRILKGTVLPYGIAVFKANARVFFISGRPDGKEVGI